jgi:hypothetical protein
VIEGALQAVWLIACYAAALLLVIVFFLAVFVHGLLEGAFHLFVDETYRIPNTQVVVRTGTTGLNPAPWLEVKNGSEAPLNLCMGGDGLERVQIYLVGETAILLETRHDTFFIDSAPFAVKGPAQWMRVWANDKPCRTDARGVPREEDRSAVRAGLITRYVGAFDRRARPDKSRGFWRYWTWAQSPEQWLSPPDQF